MYNTKLDFNSIIPTTPNTSKMIELARKNPLPMSLNNKYKTLVFLIDEQVCFSEIGTLPVKGFNNSLITLLRFLYDNMLYINAIDGCLDCHSLYSIFFQEFWNGQNNEQPAINSVVSYDDVANNVWRPYDPKLIEYVKQYLSYIESTNSQNIIWPHHGIVESFGAEGASLDPQLYNFIVFFNELRKSKTIFVKKGLNPLTECYGWVHSNYNDGISPKYSKQVILMLQKMETFDRIVIAGQAADFCVITSVLQMCEYFIKVNPAVLKRIYILIDCMNSIGEQHETERRFQELSSRYGINIVKSTEFSLS